MGDLIDSRLEWWSTKNTYLKTTERIAQEVLQTVGRGIIDDHLACGKEVPARWLDERRKCHVQMAFEMWGGEPRNGNPFSARDLVRRMIPRLWIRQLQESGCKCPCCGECEKETLEHFLFKCRRYMKERLALVRRIRERLTLGEERDVEPLIRMVLGLDDVSTHKAERE